MLCTGNRTVGSNPTLSARLHSWRSPAAVESALDGRWTLRRRVPVRKVLLLCVVISALLASGAGAAAQRRRAAPRLAAVCGDPTVRCRTTVEFQPYQLPFRIPA